MNTFFAEDGTVEARGFNRAAYHVANFFEEVGYVHRRGVLRRIGVAYLRHTHSGVLDRVWADHPQDARGTKRSHRVRRFRATRSAGCRPQQRARHTAPHAGTAAPDTGAQECPRAAVATLVRGCRPEGSLWLARYRRSGYRPPRRRTWSTVNPRGGSRRPARPSRLTSAPRQTPRPKHSSVRRTRTSSGHFVAALHTEGEPPPVEGCQVEVGV
jgi:hypothetical protein